MKLAGLGNLFAMLYNDRMDIYRTERSQNDDDTTDISYHPTPKYSDVACRISFNSDDTASDSEVDRNPVRSNPKIFCRSDVDLKAGDYVVVTRYTDAGAVAATYKGLVAQPSWYSTHQESFMHVDEGA